MRARTEGPGESPAPRPSPLVGDGNCGGAGEPASPKSHKSTNFDGPTAHGPQPTADDSACTDATGACRGAAMQRPGTPSSIPPAPTQGARGEERGAAGVSPSVASLLRWGKHQLNIAGVEHPNLDAEMLLRQALGISRAAFFARLQDTVAQTVINQYHEYIDKRVHNIPVQYIIGKQEFMGLEFHVTPAVLIPRPETEILVELVLERLRPMESTVHSPQSTRENVDRGNAVEACRGFTGGSETRPYTRPGSPSPSSPLGTRDSGLGTHPISIADIGCGSGAIALSLAHYLPNSHVFAVDISPDAIDIARDNAQRLGVSERVTFLQGDLLAPLKEAGLQGMLHAVVSNPPYIPRATIPTLDAHVQAEPHLALDGGVDGLDYYRRIAAEAGEYLISGGLLAVEVGHDQAADVAAMFLANGFDEIEIHKDLAGIGRVVTGTRCHKS